jgi:hypothetical protein
MFTLVLAILLIAVGFVLLTLKSHPRRLHRFPAIPMALGVALVGASWVYKLDAGEAAVSKTFGTVGNQAISATGIHLKAPWRTSFSSTPATRPSPSTMTAAGSRR